MRCERSSSISWLASMIVVPVANGSTSFSSVTRPMIRSRSGSMVSPPSTIAERRDAVERAAVDLRDDHVLRDVHETPRQVARVGRLQRRVGQALAGAVRRDEVLEHRQPFTEVRRDGRLDDLARRLGHQAAHAGQLTDLLLAAARARVGHDVDRVEATGLVLVLHLVEHLVRDLLGRLRPDRDDLVAALAVGDCAFLVLLLDADDFVPRLVDELLLLARDDQVVDADRQARLGRVREPEVLEPVEHLDGPRHAVAKVAELHQHLQALLLQQAVDEGQPLRQRVVEDHAADGRR